MSQRQPVGVIRHAGVAIHIGVRSHLDKAWEAASCGNASESGGPVKVWFKVDVKCGSVQHVSPFVVDSY